MCLRPPVTLRLDKLPVGFLGSQAKAMEEGKEEAKETPQKSFLMKAALEGVFSSGGRREHLYPLCHCHRN